MMYRLSSAKRYFLALLLLAGFLSGCVTTSDSRFSREADRDDAVDSFVQLGTAYIAQGNTERARTHLERALELDPQSAPALSAMGLVYRSEGKRAMPRMPSARRFPTMPPIPVAEPTTVPFSTAKDATRRLGNSFVGPVRTPVTTSALLFSSISGWPRSGSVISRRRLTHTVVHWNWAEAMSVRCLPCREP